MIFIITFQSWLPTFNILFFMCANFPMFFPLPHLDEKITYLSFSLQETDFFSPKFFLSVLSC
jgi:hypothetical protein